MKTTEQIINTILIYCKRDGVEFTDLDDESIGLLTYQVQGLGGFMNPKNIIGYPNEKGEFPTLNEITSSMLGKVGAGYRKEYLKLQKVASL